MIQIENESGVILTLELDESPYISIESKGEEEDKAKFFYMTQINLDELTMRFFRKEVNSFYLQMDKWLESEGKELILKEDLKAMLNVIAHSIGDMYNRRNAMVEAISRLEVIYDRYKEKDNES